MEQDGRFGINAAGTPLSTPYLVKAETFQQIAALPNPDDQAKQERKGAINMLGNLTLLHGVPIIRQDVDAKQSLAAGLPAMFYDTAISLAHRIQAAAAAQLAKLAGLYATAQQQLAVTQPKRYDTEIDYELLAAATQDNADAVAAAVANNRHYTGAEI